MYSELDQSQWRWTLVAIVMSVFHYGREVQAKMDKSWVPGHPGDYILYGGT